MYHDAAVRIDFARREVHVDSRPVRLSPLEFRLLTALVRNPGMVMAPDALLDSVWGQGYGTRESLKVYVGTLRRKLQMDPKLPQLIETVRGFGYRYRPPGA